MFNQPRQPLLHKARVMGCRFKIMLWAGFVKPTITVMAKSQKGGSQPPKKQNGGKVTAPKHPAATQDSTKYFADKVHEHWAKSQFTFSKSKQDSELEKRNQAAKDLVRQRYKGKPGYDKNGYPIKKK